MPKRKKHKKISNMQTDLQIVRFIEAYQPVSHISLIAFLDSILHEKCSRQSRRYQILRLIK